MTTYCNPGCKNTIFQDGKEFPSIDFSYFTNLMEGKSKEQKDMIQKYLEVIVNPMKETRKKNVSRKRKCIKK